MSNEIKSKLADALMDSPYLDVLYGDRHVFEMAAEELMSSGVTVAEKITMCKDCRYAYHNSSNESLKCKYHAWDAIEVTDTDFCSRGERVDE